MDMMPDGPMKRPSRALRGQVSLAWKRRGGFDAAHMIQIRDEQHGRA